MHHGAGAWASQGMVEGICAYACVCCLVGHLSVCLRTRRPFFSEHTNGPTPHHQNGFCYLSSYPLPPALTLGPLPAFAAHPFLRNTLTQDPVTRAHNASMVHLHNSSVDALEEQQRQQQQPPYSEHLSAAGGIPSPPSPPNPAAADSVGPTAPPAPAAPAPAAGSSLPPRILLLPNTLTSGASGAWNTGLLAIAEHVVAAHVQQQHGTVMVQSPRGPPAGVALLGAGGATHGSAAAAATQEEGPPAATPAAAIPGAAAVAAASMVTHGSVAAGRAVGEAPGAGATPSDLARLLHDTWVAVLGE